MLLYPDENNRRLFIASFIRKCGYPKRLGFEHIVRSIVARSNWDDLADDPMPEIEAFIKTVGTKNLNQIERRILEDEDGLSALENLLQYLAFLNAHIRAGKTLEEVVPLVLKQQQLDMDESLAIDISLQYADILYIEGRKTRRAKPLKIQYYLQIDGGVPFAFGLKLFTGRGGGLLPKYIPDTVGKLGCTIDNVDHLPEVRVSGRVLSPVNNSASINILITRLQRGFHTVSLSVGQHEILTLRRDNILLFDSEGKEISDSEVDVPLDADIWALPINKTAIDLLRRDFKEEVLYFQGNPAASVFKITREQSDDNDVRLPGTHLRFCRVMPDVRISDPAGFAARFSGRLYTANSNIEIIAVTVHNKPLGIEVYSEEQAKVIDKFRGNCILNLQPGEYRVDFIAAGKRVSFRKIGVIPDFELNESSLEVIVSQPEGWRITLQAEGLQETSAGVYQPQIRGRIPAIAMFTRGSYSFSTRFFLDTSPDVEILKEEEEGIENGSIISLSEIRNSGLIRFRIRSRDGEPLSYSVIVKPKTVRFTFPRLFTFSIHERRFYWTRIFEIFEKLQPESCSLKIMQGQDFKFQCTITADMLVDLDRNEASALLQPKQKTEKLKSVEGGAFAYHLHNLLAPWDPPLETGAMSSESGYPVLTYRQIPAGYWMVYLVKLTSGTSDFSVVSRGYFFKKNHTSDAEIQRDALEEALSSLFPRDKHTFLSCGDALWENGFFNDREKSEQLVTMFEHYLRYRPYDFLLYSIFPVYFPFLPLWWKYGRQTGSADKHISGHDFPLAQDPFSTHGRFSWFLVRVSDFSKLFEELHSRDTFTEAFLFEMHPYLDDDLFWVQWIWILSSFQIEISKEEREKFLSFMKSFPSVFRQAVADSDSFSTLMNTCVQYLEQQGTVGEAVISIKNDDTALRHSIAGSLNELRQFDNRDSWTGLGLKLFEDANWKMKLPDLFIDEFYPLISRMGPPFGKSLIDRLAQGFITMMQVAERDQFFERVPAMNICLAMTAFDLVSYQLDQPTILDERLRLLLARVFKENEHEAWNHWYLQWLGLRLEEIIVVKQKELDMKEKEADESEV